jgi:hypothetical protein
VKDAHLPARRLNRRTVRQIFAVLLAVALVTPVAADPFRSLNRLDVVPLGPDSFEVFDGILGGASGIWCAAADYTRAIGRDVPQQRLFISKPRGPAISDTSRKSVAFTYVVNDTPAARPLISWLNVGNTGYSLSVSHAFYLCDDYKGGPARGL